MKRIIAIVMITSIGIFAAACAGNLTNNVNNATAGKNAANAGNSANSNSPNRHENEHEMMNGEHQRMDERQMEKGMDMRPGMNHNTNVISNTNRER